MKKFTYTKTSGYIEFALISKPAERIRIYAKDSKILETEAIDIKMFASYRRMGLVIEDVFANDEPTVSVIEEPVVKPIVETPVAPVDEPVELPVEEREHKIARRSHPS